MGTPETNIDRLLKARGEIDDQLRQHKSNSAVFFTDVVASTEYFDRYGDTAGFAMVDRHAQLGTAIVREFEGRVVKTIGDSVMAEFSDPVACVRAAIELQRKLYNVNEKLPQRDRLQLRIGINYGSCFRQEGDLFGDAVNLAARITKRTGPGQILVSASVHRAAQQDPHLKFSPLGPVNFKGKAEKEKIFEVVWTDSLTYSNLRRTNTAAITRGELHSPGLQVQDLIQQSEDLTRDEITPGGEIPSLADQEGPYTRFVAGTAIANRYRIVTWLGKGGMGEVYRAEDLKLQQEIALKFLPKEIQYDGASLARLHQEVRIARQVSHRNVCRVFDVGDSDGMPFLTMEYVDGEDLQSLLRRIGHFPQDRAIDLSRQICSGLAAAHEFGILHRDLKPANIMVDARGRARIMDFGLATLAQSVVNADTQAGTPAYMAPEQLDGGKLTLKTDIYALGLVLYEVFTGEQAFRATTFTELLRQRQQPLPKSPSAVVKDLDPRVDDAILQCLENDPAKRPASAFQVAFALPGGDPVRAALEAGETPSPEMVAASGPSGGLRPAVAWGLLTAAWLLMAATVVLNAPGRFYNHISLTLSPEALRERARDFAQKVGIGGLAVDSASNFDFFPLQYLSYIEDPVHPPTHLGTLSPLVVTFWYRQSPQFMSGSSFLGTVTFDEPALTVAGMIGLDVDASGRVTRYIEVPPLKDDQPAGPSPDWNRILTEAGYGNTNWMPVAPQLTPPQYADARAAYQGVLPDIPGTSTRVEMATLHGKLVSLETTFPWSQKEPTASWLGDVDLVVIPVLFAVFVITIFWSIWLCRRNFLKGRGDRRGAFRLALFASSVNFIILLLVGHHVPTVQEIDTIIREASLALIVGAAFWVLYLALEPQARRYWPLTIVSWSRLLAARVRDPLVGRDVLVGCFAGALISTLDILQVRIPNWLGGPQRLSLPLELFTGAARSIAHAVNGINESIVFGFGLFLLVAMLRALLRRSWLVYGIFLVLAMLSSLPENWNFWVVKLSFGLATSILLLAVLIRFGLVALIVTFYVSSIFGGFPITFDTSSWFFGIGLPGLLIPALMALYGFYFSLAGKPAFGALALDE